jgi:hypothetical protein
MSVLVSVASAGGRVSSRVGVALRLGTHSNNWYVGCKVNIGSFFPMEIIDIMASIIKSYSFTFAPHTVPSYFMAIKESRDHERTPLVQFQ